MLPQATFADGRYLHHVYPSNFPSIFSDISLSTP
jgi:hypothetical protein